VLTEEDGHYTIVSPPGPITITVSKADYDAVSGTGTVNQGSTLKFSPALNPTGTTPQNPEVTVKGILKDGETGTSLVDALITIIGTEHQGRSDETGAFFIVGITPGELTIEISLKGYQVGRFTVLAPPGGVVDLDTTHLPKIVPAPTTTLIGQVTNANTGEPIEGAHVTLKTLNSGALTDNEGNYRIEEIDVLEFKISASALNYLTTNYTLTVNQVGLVIMDFNLTPAAESPLEIISVTTEQSNYDALNAVQMEVVLNNKESEVQPVQLLLKIVNQDQEIVEQWTPVVNSFVTVEPNSSSSTHLEWQTARHSPGEYQVIVQALDGNSGQLLAEQGTPITIEPTSRLGGYVAFDPPIAQLAAKKPVKITAQIANQGNLPIEATTVTATLSLKNPGYQQHKHEVLVESFVQGHELMSYPRGIDKDQAGNFYVTDYRNHSVLKITPTGTVSEFATDLYYPIDLDFDQQGNLYVLGYYSSSYNNKGLIRLGIDGSRSELGLPNISSSRALEVLEDGQILVVAGNTLYSVELIDNNTTANITKLIAGGLNAPRGLVADSQGNFFIADYNGNAVVKWQNNELLTFVSDIKQPSGITVDTNDNLYITSFGDNSLVKITPDGQKTVIASGLAGPYDVKIAPDGNFVVSNYNAHEIVTITPSGEISTRVQPTLYGPTALTYDANGHLYIGNWNRNNLIEFSVEEKTAAEISYSYHPRDILTLNGYIYGLESNSIIKIDPSDNTKTTLTSKLNNPYALIKAPDGNGFFISENYAHRISQVSTTGEITSYTTVTRFTHPRSLRQDTQGNLYLLDDNGYITKFTETGQILHVISNLKSPRGLAIDNEDNLIVSESNGKRVLRIDQNDQVEILVEKLPFTPYAIAVNSSGEVVVAPLNSDTLYSVENGQISEYTKLNEGQTGYDMLFDSSDNLWLSQYYQHQVLKLLAGSDETISYPLANRKYSPQTLSLDGAGGILVGGSQYIQQIDSQGNITELVDKDTVGGQNIWGFAFDQTGQLWIANGNDGVLSRFNTDYTLAKRYASIYYPKGIAWVNNSLIVANSSRKTAILRLNQPEALPEIILDGSYEQVEATDAQTVLLTNASSVSRFNLTTGEITTLVSGFRDIEALTVGSDGHFVIADYNNKQNKVAFYESDGTLRDSFIGLVNPKGLLFDANEQLLVSNQFPNSLSQVRDDGLLEPFSFATSSIESMWLESDGQITVSRGTEIITLSNTGERLNSFQVPSHYLKGLYRDAEGQLWIASDNQGALLKMAADGSYQKMASGLSQPREIETGLSGKPYLADYSRGVVMTLNGDNSLSLVASDLPKVEAVTFTSDGTLFVAYNDRQIAELKVNGELTDLPLTDVIPNPIIGLTSDGQDIFPVSVQSGRSETAQILKIPTQTAELNVQPGEVIYTVNTALPALSLEGETVTVEFGAWTPTLSGDFELQVTATAPTTTQLSNMLHVGPSANGTLSLAQSQVFPGDRAVKASLSLQGADSTSITQIDPQGTTLAALSGTSGYGLAADNQGNIYSVDTNRKRIVKITPDGTISDFVINLSVGDGLAIDAQDNIYATSAKNILKITPPSEQITTPQVTTFATLSGTVEAVAVGYDNQVYTVDSSNRLSRVTANGSVETITTVGLNNPKALTIDVFGNFYVLNYALKNGTHSIIKITPDGKFSSLYFDQARFEFEGVNVTADCSNNLLFAPFNMYFAPLDKSIGEETIIAQLIGDTGEVREALYGPSIDPAMADMDVLFYDRFGQRILIWSDYVANQGKIFSFPVICGGIDVDVHLKTRTDVDLTSTDPTSTSVIELADGMQEMIWNLSQVDNRGQTVQLNLFFQDLTEGETRPALEDAFLVFHNSFDPDNPVQVPLTIPELLATRQMRLVPMLMEERYGPNAPMEIQVEVINDSDTDFNGTIELSIVDENNQPVADLSPVAVTDLTGPTSQFYTTQWNTGTTYADNYKLVSRLVDPVRTYDKAELAFEIWAPEATSQLSSSTTTNKSNYQTTEVVLINNLIENLSPNHLIDDALVTVTITDPNGQLIHVADQPLGQLAPRGVRELRIPYQLPSTAELGTYLLQVTITDSDTQLSAQQTEFTVTEQLELALSGQVDAQLTRLTTKQTQICHETITHQGTQPIDELVLQQLLLDMDTLAPVDVQTTTLTLAAGDQHTLTHTFEAGSLKPSHYACVLQMQEPQTQAWKTLDFETFTVNSTLSSECSTVYAIHDQGVSDTQLFTYELGTNLIRPLGPLYPGRDLEGLDLHSHTHQLYASSGKTRSRLYQVDGNQGDLNLIGDIGFSNVPALSFHPDGTLWGWAKNTGLIQINLETGQGQLMYADKQNVEGLAWDNKGTQLYGTVYDRLQHQTTLWIYDGQSFTPSCDNLPGEVESLEMHPDGQLLFGTHDETDMNVHLYDINSCQIMVEAAINTAYNDIEGIAWPSNQCTPNQQALKAFLTALSDTNVYLSEDGDLQITLDGQTHHGQLATEITTGTTPIVGNQLYLKALPDVNEDGIDDFSIIYPNGDEQTLYYLGIISN
jgi:sugar lactone lactonase YvrE